MEHEHGAATQTPAWNGESRRRQQRQKGCTPSQEGVSMSHLGSLVQA